ncbi:hypothetical protein GCM10027355_32370 [Haloplanus salinarum]
MSDATLPGKFRFDCYLNGHSFRAARTRTTTRLGTLPVPPKNPEPTLAPRVRTMTPRDGTLYSGPQ